MAFGLRRFLEHGPEPSATVVGGGIGLDPGVPADPYTLRLALNRRSTSLEGLQTSLNPDADFTDGLQPASTRTACLHDRGSSAPSPYRLHQDSSERYQQRLEPFDRYRGEPRATTDSSLITLSSSTAL